MEPWNRVRKQNSLVPRFHGTVEHMEPQFVNLMVSNNASHAITMVTNRRYNYMIN